MNVPDVPCITTAEYLSHDLNVVVQPVMQRDENLNASQIVSIPFLVLCLWLYSMFNFYSIKHQRKCKVVIVWHSIV